MNYFFVTVAFIFGTLIGSFLNVVIFRSVDRYRAELKGKRKKLDLVWQRSACQNCKRTLRWWELVPLISFLILRGRCQRCGKKISPQYPLIEVFTGLVFALLFSSSIITPLVLFTTLLSAAIVVTLIVLGMIDFYTFLLPDVFVAIISIQVLVLLLLMPEKWTLDILWGVLAGSGFLFLLWLVTRGQGIGLGDIKLMIPIGALLGLAGTILLLLMAFWVGGIVGLVLLWQRRAGLKTAIPFGPFLVGSAIVLILFPALPDLFFSLLW